MQYILSEDEYKNLAHHAARSKEIESHQLQKVCTGYANLEQQVRRDSKNSIACKDGRPTMYCDDCPAIDLCQSYSKEFSK